MISKLVRWMSLGVCHIIETTIPSGFTTLLPLQSSIHEVHDVVKGDEAQLNGASGSDRKKEDSRGHCHGIFLVCYVASEYGWAGWSLSRMHGDKISRTIFPRQPGLPGCNSFEDSQRQPMEHLAQFSSYQINIFLIAPDWQGMATSEQLTMYKKKSEQQSMT